MDSTVCCEQLQLIWQHYYPSASTGHELPPVQTNHMEFFFMSSSILTLQPPSTWRFFTPECSSSGFGVCWKIKRLISCTQLQTGKREEVHFFHCIFSERLSRQPDVLANQSKQWTQSLFKPKRHRVLSESSAGRREKKNKFLWAQRSDCSWKIRLDNG